MGQEQDCRTRCPACDAEDSELVWPARGSQPFHLERCRRCQLTFTLPRLAADEMLAYYDDRYYGKNNVRFGPVFERLVSWCRRRRADKICQYVPRGRVLDIGCGRGHILANLRQRGWTVQGVELNQAAVRHARDMLGLDVRVESFDAERFPKDHFDVVILWHVLEHLHDINAAISGCARILKPGGLLAVSVPNVESWQATLTRDHWFHLDLPRHYFHFSEQWLRAHLAKQGLRVVEVNHFAFEQNPFGWIQSILNCCGLPRNLLYEMLKSASAQSIVRPFWRYPMGSIGSLAGFLGLLAPAVFMLIPETIFRRGGTIDLFAIKDAS